MKKVGWIIIFLMFFWAPIRVGAVEIHLSNGDRISGEIIKETDQQIELLTQAMGKVVVNKTFIQEPAEKKEAPLWNKEIALGYSQTGGNTQEAQGSFTFSGKRKTKKDETTFKAEAIYSSSGNKMDAKKFYAMGRYAFSFGQKLKWYNFYKVEGDQDRFANIDYRIIPSTGVGHWFWDEEDYKAMVELAVGIEHTEYRDDTDSKTEAVLIPRGFIEKKLLDNLRISEDIILYPSLGDIGEYHLKSETALVNSLSDAMSLKISFIDEYNSNPGGSIKKNDYRLISSVVYQF